MCLTQKHFGFTDKALNKVTKCFTLQKIIQWENNKKCIWNMWPTWGLEHKGQSEDLWPRLGDKYTVSKSITDRLIFFIY